MCFYANEGCWVCQNTTVVWLCTFPMTSNTVVSFTPRFHTKPPLGTPRAHTNGVLTLETAPLRISSTNPQQQTRPLFTHRHTHSPHSQAQQPPQGQHHSRGHRKPSNQGLITCVPSISTHEPKSLYLIKLNLT